MRSSTKTRSSRPIIRRKKKTPDPAADAPPLAYLGLGSNLGNRGANLESAIREIAALASVLRVSAFYRTEPVGFRDQPDFWNAVVEIEWRGTPAGLLRAVRRVERRVGRTPTFVNGPREIDVDILDLGGRLRKGRDPLLPHPRLCERRFALAPLAEVSPGWRDPRSGRTATELLKALPQTPRVRRLPASRSRARLPRR
ncbi:MAG: 2-amino-4-hydroxy-6-hydroxymethyldihydropteridine diphosphokinase [Acidobacteriota bacterium]